jgi:competence protein ComEC
MKKTEKGTRAAERRFGSTADLLRKTKNVFHLFSCRPMVMCALLLAAGVGLGRYCTVHFLFWAVLLGTCILASIVLSLLKMRAAVLLALAAALLGAALCAIVSSPGYGYIPPAGQRVNIEGTIAELPESSGGTTVLILDDATAFAGGSGTALGGRMRLKVSGGEDLRYGQRINAMAAYAIPKSTYAGSDRRAYLLARRIWYEGTAGDIRILGSSTTSDPYGIALLLRESMEKTMDALYGEAGGTMKGMLLGDKADIPEEGMDAFRKTGTAHLLAVSGLNVGFIAGAVYLLMNKIAKKRTRLKLAITLGLLAVHCVITGLSPPVLRATLMASLLLAGKAAGQKTDTPSALAASFILILLINPMWLFDAGFQLSYAGVAGILMITRRVQKGLRRLPNWLSTAIGASVGGQAGTLPVSAMHFGSIPVLGLLVNVIAVPLSAVLVISGFISVLLGMIWLPLGIPFAFAAKGILLAILASVAAGAMIPLMSVDTQRPPWWFFIAYFGSLYAMSDYLVAGKKTRSVSAALLGALSAGMAAFLIR